MKGIKVSIYQLRIAAIEGILIYIDDKRYSYSDLLKIDKNLFFELIIQDLRHWRVISI